MSDDLEICSTCLRTDIKLREIDKMLIEFHERSCGFAVNFTNKYCTECENSLRKICSFQNQCMKAMKILQEWKNTITCTKAPLNMLHTLLSTYPDMDSSSNIETYLMPSHEELNTDQNIIRTKSGISLEDSLETGFMPDTLPKRLELTNVILPNTDITVEQRLQTSLLPDQLEATNIVQSQPLNITSNANQRNSCMTIVNKLQLSFMPDTNINKLEAETDANILQANSSAFNKVIEPNTKAMLNREVSLMSDRLLAKVILPKLEVRPEQELPTITSIPRTERMNIPIIKTQGNIITLEPMVLRTPAWIENIKTEATETEVILENVEEVDIKEEVMDFGATEIETDQELDLMTGSANRSNVTQNCYKIINPTDILVYSNAGREIYPSEYINTGMGKYGQYQLMNKVDRRGHVCNICGDVYWCKDELKKHKSVHRMMAKKATQKIKKQKDNLKARGLCEEFAEKEVIRIRPRKKIKKKVSKKLLKALRRKKAEEMRKQKQRLKKEKMNVPS